MSAKKRSRKNRFVHGFSATILLRTNRFFRDYSFADTLYCSGKHPARDGSILGSEQEGDDEALQKEGKGGEGSDTCPMSFILDVTNGVSVTKAKGSDTCPMGFILDVTRGVSVTKAKGSAPYPLPAHNNRFKRK